MSLPPEFLERHKRHLLLKEIGGPGVQKLRAASVSIVGAGALGGPCALYLAAAGIGRIEIWDDDHVERSNLQRQIQFRDADVSAGKVNLLSARLTDLNPDIEVAGLPKRFKPSAELSGDILIDASDNFETRFAMNEMAIATERAMVHGAAAGWQGQVSVFAPHRAETAPCYRCWVNEMPPTPEACDEVGVVGALTGMVGAAMALETIKLVTGAGTPLIGRLLVLDGLSQSPRTIGLRRDPACPSCGTDTPI